MNGRGVLAIRGGKGRNILAKWSISTIVTISGLRSILIHASLYCDGKSVYITENELTIKIGRQSVMTEPSNSKGGSLSY